MKRLQRLDQSERLSKGTASSYAPIAISLLALGVSLAGFLNSYWSRSDSFKQMRVSRQIEECLQLAEAISETNSKLASLEAKRFWQDEDTNRIDDLSGEAPERGQAQIALSGLKRLVVRSKVIFPKVFRDNLDKLEKASDAVFRENSDVIFGKSRKALSSARLEEMAFFVIGDCNKLANSNFNESHFE